MSTATGVGGVDPGTRGGLVVLRADGKAVYTCAMRPALSRPEFRVILDQFADTLKFYSSLTLPPVFLEKVNSMPRDGHVGAFTFGRVYGLLEMGLVDRGLAVYDVVPVLWQTKLGCLSGGDKNVTKRRAAELFPDERVTHSTADALLIAEFGRRWLLEG